MTPEPPNTTLFQLSTEALSTPAKAQGPLCRAALPWAS